ncbi:rhodanese-like domain-containing protein [Endozoicomonas sp. GU-1]|uniref:rhodanese-like domain-containing protein n=1 Tax=Endozoicomonas sp. GU-1 TaxID=3009078 RepID=UPI0022B4368E|nr:rhodanese-like domain-containing protein [Endozoicomonas sp. GU-1]WBA87952.1 rhodanese-like domain-containing protein [Endozoicomonas sp. GU-1]
MKWISISAAILLSALSFILPAQEEAPEEINGVITINTHQAKRLHDIGALFIDVRPYQQWQYGHVDGSHSLDLRGGVSSAAGAGGSGKETPIVIYGNSTYHMRGAIGSYLAALWGYERVFFLRDGYYSWLALDYPVTLKSDVVGESYTTGVMAQ